MQNPMDSANPLVPDGVLHAESKLHQVMGVLKKNETELPPDVAKVLKDTSLKDGKLKINGMHDAVEELGNARAALEQACYVRSQKIWAHGGNFFINGSKMARVCREISEARAGEPDSYQGSPGRA